MARYPIGHPKRIINPDSNNISNYEGLIFCAVVPPKKLFYPILPSRINKKLMFTLCYTCAKSESYFCNHSDIERSLVGVWTTPELKMALRYGYEIINIHEIWHFERTAKINENEGGLFENMINDLIKGKIEASGWPENCTTEEDKDKYIQSYYEKEKIKLNKENINYNAGKRYTFKIAINSFWGKFGQDSHKFNKTEFINTPEQFFNLLSDEMFRSR